MPFKDWIVWKPDDENWWNAYNHVKHNGFTNKKEGNFFNVIESLAALFLLNCLHKDAKEKLIEYGYYEFSLEQYREYKTSVVGNIIYIILRLSILLCRIIEMERT